MIDRTWLIYLAIYAMAIYTIRYWTGVDAMTLVLATVGGLWQQYLARAFWQLWDDHPRHHD